MLLRTPIPALLALVSMALMGCGPDGYAELQLVPVGGVITLDGQPLSGAKVSFEGQDKRQAIGITDSSGRYRLLYDSQTAGVTPGAKIVRITTADVGVEGGGFGEGVEVPKETIPSRYNIDSTLTANVTSATTAFDFALLSASKR